MAIFVPFLLLYVAIIAVFTRIFETMSHLRLSRFNHTSFSNEDSLFFEKVLFSSYFKALYTTFRLSLNIVDVSRLNMGYMDMVMHWLYVMILPFVIFNYIIGVIASHLSPMFDVRTEKAILHRGRVVIDNISLLGIGNKTPRRSPSDAHLTVSIPITDDCLCARQRERILSQEDENDDDDLKVHEL